MKRILILCACVLMSLLSHAQLSYVLDFSDTSVRYRGVISDDTIYSSKDSFGVTSPSYFRVHTMLFQVRALSSYKPNAGKIGSIVWADDLGNILRSPTDSLYLSSLQVSRALGFIPTNPNGSTNQYIRGDGTKATFPTNVSTFTNDIGYLTGITSGQIITALGYTPVTQSRTITINGTALDLSANRSWTIPTSTTPTYNTGVTRPVNGTTYTVSSTQPVRMYYTIDIACTASIGSNASGSVLFEYSTNGGSSYISLGEVKNSNTVTLAIALNSVTIQRSVIAVEVPPNALCRMTSTTAGTTTITYIRGQEVLY